MSGRVSWWFRSVAAPAVFLTGDPAPQLAAATLQTDQFVGAAGCQSSSCHGGAGAKRSQFLTWVKDDFHSRAYAVLVTARSARMAETLGLPAAQTSGRCTICHSPLQTVGPVRLAKTAQIDEGVSCENCHGAANQWLRAHTRKDWTYATDVGAGMRDLRSYYVRANTCVACHQNLEADLLAAGHPELTFELDGQSVAEPKHWRDEDSSGGARAWLVGQAVALRELSWAAGNNPTPEANAEARWNALVWLLAKTTAGQSRLPTIEPPRGAGDRARFVSERERADLLARQAASIAWDDRLTKAMLRALAGTGPEFVAAPSPSPEHLFARATRLVLALDRLARARVQGMIASASAAALKTLFEDVRNRPDFAPAKFSADLATFRTTLETAP
ncbi:MAG TPA: multiheme c-type cytochrome [Chthoniobacterales bacterium]|nr:multiheme c-type cytochrome [Chthoniobacterales bacterium]